MSTASVTARRCASIDEARPHGRAVVGPRRLRARHLRIVLLSLLAKIVGVRPMPLHTQRQIGVSVRVGRICCDVKVTSARPHFSQCGSSGRQRASNVREGSLDHGMISYFDHQTPQRMSTGPGQRKKTWQDVDVLCLGQTFT